MFTSCPSVPLAEDMLLHVPMMIVILSQPPTLTPTDPSSCHSDGRTVPGDIVIDMSIIYSFSFICTYDGLFVNDCPSWE